MKMLLAVLATVVLAVPVMAQDCPQGFDCADFQGSVQKVEKATVPPGAALVKKATIEPMRDPSDAFAIQFVLDGFATQCDLLPTNVVKVLVREGLGGTYFRSGFRGGWYFCDIYTPDVATARNYWMAIMRYQQGSDAPFPLVLQQ